MTKCVQLIFILALVIVLDGCASTRGPALVQVYDGNAARNQIAIIRLDQKASVRILYCDGVPVSRTVRYLLVKPGRHELVFSVSGQTLFELHNISGKKYLEATGGSTYVLKSETGWLSVGDKWFPEVIDATNDAALHVKEIPLEGVDND